MTNFNAPGALLPYYDISTCEPELRSAEVGRVISNEVGARSAAVVIWRREERAVVHVTHLDVVYDFVRDIVASSEKNWRHNEERSVTQRFDRLLQIMAVSKRSPD